jgi:F-type H+-transporting ATPase subunit c
MTKKNVMWMLALLFLASPMIFAQAANPADTNAIAQAHSQWTAIAAGFSMAIASGLCGLAQAKAVAAVAEGTARNPGAADAIRFALILGLALIESMALYTFVIIAWKVG